MSVVSVVSGVVVAAVGAVAADVVVVAVVQPGAQRAQENLKEDDVEGADTLTEAEQQHVVRWMMKKVEEDGNRRVGAQRRAGLGERTSFGLLQGECRLGRDSMSATSQKLASSSVLSSRCGGVGFAGRSLVDWR